MPNFLDTIYKQAGIGESRTSILNPLQWMLVILVGGLSLTIALHSPAWLPILFAVLVTATVILIASAFIYFMVRESATLRSEDYSLAKHAMDKGLFTVEIAHEIFTRELALKGGEGIQVANVAELAKKTARPKTHVQKQEAMPE